MKYRHFQLKRPIRRQVGNQGQIDMAKDLLNNRALLFVTKHIRSSNLVVMKVNMKYMMNQNYFTM